MSAGAFETARYELSEDNGGFVMRCRVQPETLSCTIAQVANAGATAAVNAPGSATISQGRRTAGVNMRYVTLQWTGTPPAGYSGDNVRVPVLLPSTFAAWVFEATGTYLGQGVKVVGRTGETVK